MSTLRYLAALAAVFFVVSSPLAARAGADLSTDEPGSVVTVTDALDRETTFAALPQRIVQAGSSAFIVVDALYLFPEASNRIVALADTNQGAGFFASDLDSHFDRKTVIPRQVNAETVVSQGPDVVVMKNFMAGRMGAPLEQMGVASVYLDLETPEAWQNDLDTLGTLFGNSRRAEELKSAFLRRTAEVTALTDNLAEENKPRVLFLYYSVRDGAAAVNVPPASFIQTRMVEMAGGRPVWTDTELGERWTKVSLEQVGAWNPDVILVTAYNLPSAEAVDALAQDAAWAELRAVQNGEVHPVPADYHSWDQPDPRWLLGLSWMASVLQGELFGAMDLEAEAREFFTEFYGMDEEVFDRLIRPRLLGGN